MSSPQRALEQRPKRLVRQFSSVAVGGSGASGRQSILGNEDDFDYAIELLPDDEYRQAAEALPQIVDFDDIELVADEDLLQYHLTHEANSDDEGPNNNDDNNNDKDTGLYPDEIDLFDKALSASPLLPSASSKAANNNLRRSQAYGIPLQEIERDIEANDNHSSNNNNMQRRKSTFGVIGKKEFASRFSLLELQKKRVEKAVRRSSMGFERQFLAADKATMDSFLIALSQGVHVRRHQSHKDAETVRLFSHDGCQEICWEPPKAADFQRERRKGNKTSGTDGKGEGSDKEEAEENDVYYNRSVMDFFIAICGCGDDLSESHTPSHKSPSTRTGPTSTSVPASFSTLLSPSALVQRFFTNFGFQRRGSLCDYEMLAIHPATLEDPTSPGALGTETLRLSRDAFNADLTFSIVFCRDPALSAVVDNQYNSSNNNNSDNNNVDPESGAIVANAPANNKATVQRGVETLDIECSSLKTYYLLLRGFSILLKETQERRVREEQLLNTGSHDSDKEQSNAPRALWTSLWQRLTGEEQERARARERERDPVSALYAPDEGMLLLDPFRALRAGARTPQQRALSQKTLSPAPAPAPAPTAAASSISPLSRSAKNVSAKSANGKNVNKSVSVRYTTTPSSTARKRDSEAGIREGERETEMVIRNNAPFSHSNNALKQHSQPSHSPLPPAHTPQNVPTQLPIAQFLGWSSAGTQIWARLKLAGLDVKAVFSVDLQRVLLKVRAPQWRLEQVAEQMHLHRRTKDGRTQPFRISRRDTFAGSSTHSMPWSVSGNDSHNSSNANMCIFGDNRTYFRSSERQQIIDYILSSKIADGGAELDERSELGRFIAQRFPLHMHSRLTDIRHRWVTFWKREPPGGVSKPFSVFSRSYAESVQYVRESVSFFTENLLTQPLDQIAEYFGEHIAFYFAFLAFYTRWLVFPSIVGVIVFILQIHTRKLDHWACFPFALLLTIWISLLLAFWRQKSAALAYKWGVLDYEAEETERPQFVGEYVYDQASDETRKVFPTHHRVLRYCITVPVMCVALVLVLGVMSVSFYTQNKLYEEYQRGESLSLAPALPPLPWRHHHTHTGTQTNAVNATQTLTTSAVTASAQSLLSLSSHSSVLREREWVLFETESVSVSERELSRLAKDPSSHVSNPTLTVLSNTQEPGAGIDAQPGTDTHTQGWSRRISAEEWFSRDFWSATFLYPCLYGIVLNLLALLFNALALSLNEFENHRTQTAFMNRLILKIFSFQFVTTFASLYYYAFFSNDVEGGFTRICIAIFSLMTVGQWWQVLLDIALPALYTRLLLYRLRAQYAHTNRKIYAVREIAERGRAPTHHTHASQTTELKEKLEKRIRYLLQGKAQCWEEALQSKYYTFSDYTSLVIQLCFILCFGCVFPLSPLIALCNNVLLLRCKACKLCDTRQRPVAQKAAGVGVWADVLQILSVGGILTNCAILGFVAHPLRNAVVPVVGETGLALSLFAGEQLLLLGKYWLHVSLPGVPPAVQRALQRERERERESKLSQREKERRAQHILQQKERERQRQREREQKREREKQKEKEKEREKAGKHTSILFRYAHRLGLTLGTPSQALLDTQTHTPQTAERETTAHEIPSSLSPGEPLRERDRERVFPRCANAHASHSHSHTHSHSVERDTESARCVYADAQEETPHGSVCDDHMCEGDDESVPENDERGCESERDEEDEVDYLPPPSYDLLYEEDEEMDGERVEETEDEIDREMDGDSSEEGDFEEDFDEDCVEEIDDMFEEEMDAEDLSHSESEGESESEYVSVCESARERSLGERGRSLWSAHSFSSHIHSHSQRESPSLSPPVSPHRAAHSPRSPRNQPTQLAREALSQRSPLTHSHSQSHKHSPPHSPTVRATERALPRPPQVAPITATTTSHAQTRLQVPTQTTKQAPLTQPTQSVRRAQNTQRPMPSAKAKTPTQGNIEDSEVLSEQWQLRERLREEVQALESALSRERERQKAREKAKARERDFPQSSASPFAFASPHNAPTQQPSQSAQAHNTRTQLLVSTRAGKGSAQKQPFSAHTQHTAQTTQHNARAQASASVSEERENSAWVANSLSTSPSVSVSPQRKMRPVKTTQPHTPLTPHAQSSNNNAQNNVPVSLLSTLSPLSARKPQLNAKTPRTPHVTQGSLGELPLTTHTPTRQLPLPLSLAQSHAQAYTPPRSSARVSLSSAQRRQQLHMLQSPSSHNPFSFAAHPERIGFD